MGAGKGGGAQGTASAYFEALERYLMSVPDNRRWTADAGLGRDTVRRPGRGIDADAYGVRVAYVALAVPAVLSLALVLASPVRGLRLATG